MSSTVGSVITDDYEVQSLASRFLYRTWVKEVMRLVQLEDKKLAFLPTWRLLIVIGMYCAAAIQIGAWVIFTIEQKPMHPIGQICLLVGSTVALLLGHFIGKRDLKRVRDAGAVLEGTRIQIVLIILCVAAVPGSLLLLVIISGI